MSFIRQFICLSVGHKFETIDFDRLEAVCSRCKKKFKVSYDMTYGGNYVLEEI